MNITVLKVTVSEVQGAKGPYKIAELVYKSDDKIKTMKIMSWNKTVFETVSAVTAGDILDVKFEKDGKGYWQMTQATKAGKDTQPSAAPATSAKGNWETSEERQARQVYIVRQSSISSAIALLLATKGKATDVEDVKQVASELADFVFGATHKTKPVVSGDVE